MRHSSARENRFKKSDNIIIRKTWKYKQVIDIHKKMEEIIQTGQKIKIEKQDHREDLVCSIINCKMKRKCM